MNHINKPTTSADAINADSNKIQNELADSLSLADRLKEYHKYQSQSVFPLFDPGILVSSLDTIDFSDLSVKALLKEKFMRWFRIGKKFSKKTS